MFKQMPSFFEDIFSKHQCSFRKGSSTQQRLLTLLGKWKNAAEKGKMFGALLTNLTKAFECLNINMNFFFQSTRFYFTCFEINP